VRLVGGMGLVSPEILEEFQNLIKSDKLKRIELNRLITEHAELELAISNLPIKHRLLLINDDSRKEVNVRNCFGL
jgi:hypothetical protein